MTRPIPDDWISAWLDDELDSEDRARFEAELGVDTELQARVAAWRRLSDRLRSLPTHRLPASFASQIVQSAMGSVEREVGAKETLGFAESRPETTFDESEGASKVGLPEESEYRSRGGRPRSWYGLVALVGSLAAMLFVSLVINLLQMQSSGPWTALRSDMSSVGVTSSPAAPSNTTANGRDDATPMFSAEMAPEAYDSPAPVSAAAPENSAAPVDAAASVDAAADRSVSGNLVETIDEESMGLESSNVDGVVPEARASETWAIEDEADAPIRGQRRSTAGEMLVDPREMSPSLANGPVNRGGVRGSGGVAMPAAPGSGSLPGAAPFPPASQNAPTDDHAPTELNDDSAQEQLAMQKIADEKRERESQTSQADLATRVNRRFTDPPFYVEEVDEALNFRLLRQSDDLPVADLGMGSGALADEGERLSEPDQLGALIVESGVQVPSLLSLAEALESRLSNPESPWLDRHESLGRVASDNAGGATEPAADGSVASGAGGALGPRGLGRFGGGLGAGLSEEGDAEGLGGLGVEEDGGLDPVDLLADGLNDSRGGGLGGGGGYPVGEGFGMQTPMVQAFDVERFGFGNRHLGESTRESFPELTVAEHEVEQALSSSQALHRGSERKLAEDLVEATWITVVPSGVIEIEGARVLSAEGRDQASEVTVALREVWYASGLEIAADANANGELFGSLIAGQPSAYYFNEVVKDLDLFRQVEDFTLAQLEVTDKRLFDLEQLSRGWRSEPNRGRWVVPYAPGYLPAARASGESVAALEQVIAATATDSLEFDVLEVIDTPERIEMLVAWFESDRWTSNYRVETSRVEFGREVLSTDIDAQAPEDAAAELHAAQSESSLDNESVRGRESELSQPSAESLLKQSFQGRLLSDDESRFLGYFGIADHLQQQRVDEYRRSLDVQWSDYLRTASDGGERVERLADAEPKVTPRFRIQGPSEPVTGPQSDSGTADNDEFVPEAQAGRSRLLIVVPRRPVRIR